MVFNKNNSVLFARFVPLILKFKKIMLTQFIFIYIIVEQLKIEVKNHERKHTSKLS